LQARSTDAHEVCGEDLAYEVDALAAAVADLAPIVARLAKAGR
jgi:hypothetical protein